MPTTGRDLGISGIVDETSRIQVVTLDVASRLMTVRECLWNADPVHPQAPVAWGSSTTVAFNCFAADIACGNSTPKFRIATRSPLSTSTALPMGNCVIASAMIAPGPIPRG